MKQTLESAAINELFFSYACTSRNLSFAGLVYDRNAMLNMFRKGAEWHAKQSPWISIDDSFPEDNALVLCSSQIYGKVVLRWNKLAKEWLYPEENHIYCDWDKVDCWMYIPEV
ncbi:hypothetical protein K0F82_12620 [Bacteroides ovatus]|jgi:hypothetical protein|uniref:hypothetical protein n=1 Tax=Bacteroides ovatus TaxID=28116 RepID=UPI001230EB59|nr:hypothetical protein [Bacteroides ovatus]KAA3994681.1 hypothetical protein F3F40_15425 [Bacteroides ovatus]KAA3994877.1 hypothetical protein F3D58_14775 [Bacteroides ovatus]MCE8751779.1 hypothetical protein [Bacteroides ovatus]